MNDFTKEELQQLELGIVLLKKPHGTYGSESLDALMFKLGTMIDSHCDHNETMEIEAPSDLCKKGNKGPIIWKKCKKV